MSFYETQVPIANFFTDSPRDILKDAALKADKSTYRYIGLNIVKWRCKGYDADDIVTRTINNVERFIRSIIKWGLFLSAVSLYALGAASGSMVAGAIVLSSAITIYVVNNKLSAVKDEYAKVYSWGINHFRCIFGSLFTGYPVMSYKLINNLY